MTDVGIKKQVISRNKLVMSRPRWVRQQLLVISQTILKRSISSHDKCPIVQKQVEYADNYTSVLREYNHIIKFGIN